MRSKAGAGRPIEFSGGSFSWTTSPTANGTSEETGRRAPLSPSRPSSCLPPRPLAFLKWLPGYFLPWNLLFAASAVAYALFVLPDVEVMKTLAWGWILRLFIVNCIAVVPVLQRLRVPALHVAGSRKPLQVPRQISQRPEEQRLPVPEPEPRGDHPGIWNRRADLDGLRGRDPLRLRQRLRALALLRAASPLSRMPRADRADLPRVPLFLHSPADPLAPALPLGAQRPSPLGQSVAMVVAVDASGRAAPLFLILAHPRDHSFESGARASISCITRGSARLSAISASTRSRRGARAPSTAMPTATTSTINISR